MIEYCLRIIFIEMTVAVYVILKSFRIKFEFLSVHVPCECRLKRHGPGVEIRGNDIGSVFIGKLVTVLIECVVSKYILGEEFRIEIVGHRLIRKVVQSELDAVKSASFRVVTELSLDFAVCIVIGDILSDLSVHGGLIHEHQSI